MTNKEWYQRTFSVLQASERTMEGKEMKTTQRRVRRRLVPVLAVLALLFVLGGAAYSADLGGVKRIIQIWLQGDLTDALLEIEEGRYTLTYEDQEGEKREVYGGGVSFDAFGESHPVTEEEILEHLDQPEVEYREDGTVWVCYHDQVMEITDRFEDGVCHVQVVEGGKPLYMVIRYKDGYSISPHGYPSARKSP